MKGLLNILSKGKKPSLLPRSNINCFSFMVYVLFVGQWQSSKFIEQGNFFLSAPQLILLLNYQSYDVPEIFCFIWPFHCGKILLLYCLKQRWDYTGKSTWKTHLVWPLKIWKIKTEILPWWNSSQAFSSNRLGLRFWFEKKIELMWCFLSFYPDMAVWTQIPSPL